MQFQFLQYIFGIICHLISVLLFQCRNFSKWCLRRLTHLCELQRIVYNTLPGFERTRNIELALQKTDVVEIQRLTSLLSTSVIDGSYDIYVARESIVKHVVANILACKKVNPVLHGKFKNGLTNSLLDIWFIRSMGIKLEALRSSNFIRGDPVHESMLKTLWKNFTGEELEERYSKNWQLIGFQGSDPVTDFRGTGLLGLHCLIYFSGTYPEMAKKLLLHSQHPTVGYPLACLSLHMTYLCFQLLTSGVALTHFYNVIDLDELNRPNLNTEENINAEFGDPEKKLINMFYDFYSAVLVEFSTFWIHSKPKNLLDFGPVKKNFENKFIKILESKKCIFRFSTRVV